jgi:hypothetical protein
MKACSRNDYQRLSATYLYIECNKLITPEEKLSSCQQSHWSKTLLPEKDPPAEESFSSCCQGHVEPFFPLLHLNMLFHVLPDNHYYYTRGWHFNSSINVQSKRRRRRKGEETKQPICIPISVCVQQEDDDTHAIVATCDDGETCR